MHVKLRLSHRYVEPDILVMVIASGCWCCTARAITASVLLPLFQPHSGASAVLVDKTMLNCVLSGGLPVQQHFRRLLRDEHGLVTDMLKVQNARGIRGSNL